LSRRTPTPRAARPGFTTPSSGTRQQGAL
jgi:hypothetical protein